MPADNRLSAVAFALVALGAGCIDFDQRVQDRCAASPEISGCAAATTDGGGGGTGGGGGGGGQPDGGDAGEVDAGSSCDAGLNECGGACVTLASDPLNCGWCGRSCTGCASGRCPTETSVSNLTNPTDLNADGTVVAVVEGRYGLSCPQRLHLFDDATGARFANFDIGYCSNTVRVTDGGSVLYVGGTGQLHAFRPDGGVLHAGPNSGSFKSDIDVDDSYVYITAHNPEYGVIRLARNLSGASSVGTRANYKANYVVRVPGAVWFSSGLAAGGGQVAEKNVMRWPLDAGSTWAEIATADGGGFLAAYGAYVYVGESGSPARLRRYGNDGTGETTLISDAGSLYGIAADGQGVYFAVNAAGGAELRMLPADGGATVVLATEAALITDLATTGSHLWWITSSSPQDTANGSVKRVAK